MVHAHRPGLVTVKEVEIHLVSSDISSAKAVAWTAHFPPAAQSKNTARGEPCCPPAVHWLPSLTEYQAMASFCCLPSEGLLLPLT